MTCEFDGPFYDDVRPQAKDWRYYRNMRDRWNDRIGSWLLERFPWLGILL